MHLKPLWDAFFVTKGEMANEIEKTLIVTSCVTQKSVSPTIRNFVGGES
jgi:hypothetical protein